MAIKISPVKMLPTKQTSVEEWIEWHKSLKKRYGKKTANELWVRAWRRFGSSSRNTNDLRTYMEKNGVKMDKSAQDSLVDTGTSIADFGGDIFQVGKYTGIAIITVVVGGAALLIFQLAKNPAQSVGVAARAFATKGA